ncbi:FMR1-interacting protein NUFIP1-like [Diachasmimorpha longicaudata]|uniref:FMR1-interacting protein NUFIP1-like n=1 Tax=Diachasmimorpha longicaudata TaxID=58733 RepID=UPI0030B8EF77
MSPLNRGPLLGPRMPPAGMRPPPPRFGRLPMPGMPPRMPPPPMPPMAGMFGPMRQRMLPPPPRPGGMMRPGGPPPPPPLFGPRGRGPPPLMMPMMGLRGMGPRGPPIRPGPRGILLPQGPPHMRPRFPPGNGNLKAKAMNNAKKVSKLEELELKKPWMTDEIRSEIQKKNKLYAKAKKNKDAKEWEEFKDLRNKVTRMIRDAKNEYLAKNPEQAALYQDETYCDIRDENYTSNEEDESYYCEICDREFETEKLLDQHKNTHRICGIDGCTFSAHPKLVEKHITMQHCTGLYHRMKNIKTPEEIENWIAERKRKYPTESNIKLKQAETFEKKERGEIINETKGRYQPTQTNHPVREKKRRRKKRRFVDLKPEPEVDQVIESCNGVQPFRGTKSLVEIEEQLPNAEEEVSSASAIQFIEDEDDLTMPIVSKTPVKALGSLVADYGSDSDDPPEEVPIKKMKLEDPEVPDCVPSPVKAPVTKEKTTGDELSREKARKTLDRPSHQPRKSQQQPKRSMLLARLLSTSIQHERNYICQCIKYIVDANFFD